MKKLLILSLLFCMLCFFVIETDKNYKAIGTDGKSYDVIVIDSCEYVARFYKLAHKGNCRFCKGRNEN